MGRAELHRQAISNGASGLRASLMLAGMVLEDATPREGAWFIHSMPSPEAPAVACDRQPLVRRVLA